MFLPNKKNITAVWSHGNDITASQKSTLVSTHSVKDEISENNPAKTSPPASGIFEIFSMI